MIRPSARWPKRRGVALREPTKGRRKHRASTGDFRVAVESRVAARIWRPRTGWRDAVVVDRPGGEREVRILPKTLKAKRTRVVSKKRGRRA